MLVFVLERLLGVVILRGIPPGLVPGGGEMLGMLVELMVKFVVLLLVCLFWLFWDLLEEIGVDVEGR